jgi:hypothetical protein
LRAVQDTKYFDPFPLHSVDRDKGRAAKHKFASSFSAAFPTHQWVLSQPIRLTFDLFIQPNAVLQYLCGVFGLLQGGFFLIKKPLSDCPSLYTNWRTAITVAVGFSAAIYSSCSNRF